MRLFIAINFSDNTKNRLLTLQDELRRNSTRGNFTLPDNLHLTLVFLGECNVEQTVIATAVMESVAFEPFDLQIERLGCFGRGENGIWWVGLKISKELITLQSVLSDKLISEGFLLEKRRYSPHITLGRQVVTQIIPHPVEPFGETISSIELMKSERVRGKLTYTVIYVKRGKGQ